MHSIDDMFLRLLFTDEPSGRLQLEPAADLSVVEPLSKSEQRLLDNIKQVLYSPESFNQHVSMLPSILSCLINTIDNPEIDFIQLVNDLCEQPDVAREILQIANSDMYREKGKREVTTINHAITRIGLVSVAYIASTVLMSHATRTKSSYFSSFSDLIQKHSLQSAMACRDFAHQNNSVNPFSCHLLGLIHIVGMVYCFNCVSTQLAAFNINSQPSSQLYIELCQNWAAEVTVEIAKEWSLPAHMIEALEQLSLSSEYQTSPLTQFLVKADLTSKVTILLHKQHLSRQQALELLIEQGANPDYIESFFDMSTGL